MEITKNFVKVKVSELDFFNIDSIPIELHEKEVYTLKPRKLTPFSMELTNILTERFIREQLGLINQETDYRTIWYEIVDYRLKGKDLGISMKTPYIAFEKAVKEYCVKLMEYYQVQHFSFVMDNLNITAKGKAIIYDLDLKGTLLDVKILDSFVNVPFFFIICEKEVILKQTMMAIKDLGYKGFYGINTGGVGTSAVARLLLRYQKSVPQKFYVFALVDYDLAGMKIFFNLKKYFESVERLGISLEMLKSVSVDSTKLVSQYANKKSLEKQKKDCLTMFNELSIGFLEKVYYLQEIDGCRNDKIELNALSGYVSEINKEINPCVDYGNYFEMLIEKDKRFYDLNRYYKLSEVLTNSRSCHIGVPDFVNSIKSEINELIFNEIDDDSYWSKLISSDYQAFRDFNHNNEHKKDNILRNICKMIKTVNSNYKGSIKNIDSYINKQQRKLDKAKNTKDKLIKKNIRFQQAILDSKLRKTTEYIDIETRLNEILEKVKEIF